MSTDAKYRDWLSRLNDVQLEMDEDEAGLALVGTKQNLREARAYLASLIDGDI